MQYGTLCNGGGGEEGAITYWGGGGQVVQKKAKEKDPSCSFIPKLIVFT